MTDPQTLEFNYTERILRELTAANPEKKPRFFESPRFTRLRDVFYAYPYKSRIWWEGHNLHWHSWLVVLEWAISENAISPEDAETTLAWVNRKLRQIAEDLKLMQDMPVMRHWGGFTAPDDELQVSKRCVVCERAICLTYVSRINLLVPKIVMAKPCSCLQR